MVKYSIPTREAFKRSAKKTKGKHMMIPYYYRKTYGSIPRRIIKKTRRR